MTYRIRHTTTYEYHESVSLSQHVLRLRPRDLAHQLCLDSRVTITPTPRSTESHTDYFGNAVAFFAIEQPHTRLTIEAVSKVRKTRWRAPEPAETAAWEHVRDLNRGCQIGPGLDASEFVFDSPLIKTADEFAEYARESFTKGRPILEAVLHLTERIHEDYTFDTEATTVATPVETVFKTKRGVCQDFAHLQIACLRSIGLPARYVSGYIETVPPPGREKLVGSDASHAWVSFYCHGLGWIDVDPTNNQLAGSQHVTVGWGGDYSDVSPVRGVILGSGQHTVKVAVDVDRADLASA
jgi:transglutaminase-like putative cysteine protease